jgi:hypothetical protein
MLQQQTCQTTAFIKNVYTFAILRRQVTRDTNFVANVGSAIGIRTGNTVKRATSGYQLGFWE